MPQVLGVLIVFVPGGALSWSKRIARLLPHSRAGFALFTAGTGTASAVLLVVSREPSTLLASSALASMAASGGAALLWWGYRDFAAPIQEDDDED